MGYIPREESKRILEVEELLNLKGTPKLGRGTAGIISGVGSRREEEDEEARHVKVGKKNGYPCLEEDKLVGVTSGVSYLGVAIAHRLLSRGYSVRLILHAEDDIEKLRELELPWDTRRTSHIISINPVVARLSEVGSLLEAFDGCRGVFHTAGFADPSGLSGYTKSMAEMEVKACQNVMEACSRTHSVRKCVLTSSLLACLWRDRTSTDLLPIINHESWSDESLCIQKKLWCALGKLRAEKAAWRISQENGLNLATICPALIQGPDFYQRNPTATFAYLKGSQEMFESGLLATVDVRKVADAHVYVYEEMNNSASGRYIAYDRIIERPEEAEGLAKQIGMPMQRIRGNLPNNFVARCQLSDRKLSALMSRTLRDCYYQC